MEKQNVEKETECKLTNLFEQAHRDPELKRKLLRNPQAVAKEFGVTLQDDEVVQLKKLGMLTEMADEIKFGRLYPRPPIFYPINLWEIQELVDIFTHLIPGGFTGPGPIFYPADGFGQNMVFATRAYKPGWVTYPGDDQGGGTVGRGVVHIPGPIFYPASLRVLLKERLAQILRVKIQNR